MVEKIAVTRAFDLAKAREAAIKGVPQPVNDIPADREPQPVRIQIAAEIAREDQQRAKHPECRQHIRRYAPRHSGAEPVQRAPLHPGNQVFLNAIDRSDLRLESRFHAVALDSDKSDDIMWPAISLWPHADGLARLASA